MFACMSTPGRARARQLMSVAAAYILLVPQVALAHGQAALVLGLLLPVSVVPGVFLVSAIFWRADLVTKALAAVMVLAVGAAWAGINYLALLDRTLLRGLDGRPTLAALWWWGLPSLIQGATWALFAYWRRTRRTEEK